MTACRNDAVEYFTLHRIRASGASLMDEMDVPLSSIQRILGPDDRRSTEIYLEQEHEVQREAIDVFERASRTFQKSTLETTHNEDGLFKRRHSQLKT
jgi:integrase